MVIGEVGLHSDHVQSRVETEFILDLDNATTQHRLTEVHNVLEMMWKLQIVGLQHAIPAFLEILIR